MQRHNSMRLSTNRILTTHVGSPPRPEDLVELLRRQDRGEPVDAAALQARAKQAVLHCVAEQIEAGLDVVNDGEMSKMSYHVYLKHRLSGLSNIEGFGVPGRPHPRDILDHPEMIQAPLARDLANLGAAAAAAKPVDVFMTSASPGCVATYVPNRYYPDRSKYREALAVAMRTEYEAIQRAGFVLQLDCPDLAGCRHTDYQDMSESEFLKDAEKSIEALNAATAGIPSEAMRLHICWLNYAGPHTHDLPVAKLFPLLAKARPQAILFEGANPRHEHEWEDWQSAKLPDDKVLVPGVIDSTSNFVEHPRLIAHRIRRYADIVGRERVMAGADCGFGTYAGRKAVYSSVVLAKFRALAEGAAIASAELWRR